MTGLRNFTALLGGDLSKTRTIKNGAPQGSVLAPTFFNTPTLDPLDTIYRKFTYAGNLAAAYQARDTKKIEEVLESDFNYQTIHSYFNRWHLELNTTKTVTNIFHLNNHKADKALNININDSKQPNDKTHKYSEYTWTEL